MAVMFPYGTVPIDEHFRQQYTTAYSKARDYSLPEVLPSHHPVLCRLEGTYALTDQPAPWWPACVTEANPVLRKMLATVSTREFRDGCIEQARWKPFRQALSDEARAQVPASPKLAPLLEETTWVARFNQRGASDTPCHLDLIISTAPLYALYMSNGDTWDSCQHFRTGGVNRRLIGNFYDTGVAMAMVLAPHNRVWDAETVLARTTLRIIGGQEASWVALGRTYHNNETLALLLLRRLASLLDQHHLSWGFFTDVDTVQYCADGLLGTDLQQRLAAATIQVQGEPFWLPPAIAEPYIDGGGAFWERTHDSYACLHAQIRPVTPPSPADQAGTRTAF